MANNKRVSCKEQLLQELIAARQAAGVSQRDLSDALGKANNFCYYVEAGERRLEICEFIDYLNALGADASEIVGRLQGKRSKKHPPAD